MIFLAIYFSQPVHLTGHANTVNSNLVYTNLKSFHDLVTRIDTQSDEVLFKTWKLGENCTCLFIIALFSSLKSHYDSDTFPLNNSPLL